MQELQQIGDNLVTLLQTLGVIFFTVSVCLVALMVMTTFGNEHKIMLARLAAFGAIVGLIVLTIAPRISTIILTLFPIVPPK